MSFLDDFPKPPEWMAQANCASTDPEAFFPNQGDHGDAAKRVCAGCSVVAQCLDYGLEIGDQFGIYGGTNVRDRAAIRRKQRRGAA